MALTKNAMTRYRILDQMFSDKNREWTFDDICDTIDQKIDDIYDNNEWRKSRDSISPRQIRADIKYMREVLKAPIEAIPTGKNEKGKIASLRSRKHYYRYSDSDFRIFKNEISEEAMEAVEKTIGLLSQYRGLPTNEWMENIISSMEVNLGMKPNVSNYVSLDQNENLTGLNFLSDIIDNTIYKKVVIIEYQPYNKEVQKLVFHPYFVKEFNNRWFVLGYVEGDKENTFRNLALDRILRMQNIKREFIENKSTDFQKYFDDRIGVSEPRDHKEKETILLQFSEYRLPYVLSKPLHNSQRVNEEFPASIEIEVVPNKELDAKIFSFGPDVRVLSPDWYKERIKSQIENWRNFYDSEN